MGKTSISEGKLEILLDKIKTTLECILHQLEQPDIINIEAAEETVRYLLSELSDERLDLEEDDDEETILY